MRQLIGAMCAAVLALPAFATPDPSAAATRGNRKERSPGTIKEEE